MGSNPTPSALGALPSPASKTDKRGLPLCDPGPTTVRSVTVDDSQIKPRPEDEEILPGDLVVLMLEPGPFRVLSIQTPNAVIEADDGSQRIVREVAIRKIDASPPVQR